MKEAAPDGGCTPPSAYHDAIVYAEAAHVAANLINNTVEQLDSVHIGPLIAG